MPALITDRWTVIVTYAMVQGAMRFGQLRREIGPSQMALTDTLRVRQRDELVRRLVNNGEMRCRSSRTTGVAEDVAWLIDLGEIRVMGCCLSRTIREAQDNLQLVSCRTSRDGVP